MTFDARSVLYVPAHKPRMLAKLGTLPADFLVVDLEDGVGPDQKDIARGHLCEAAAGFPDDRWALRVNAAGSRWFDEDRRLVDELDVKTVVLPKAEDPATVGPLVDRWAGDGRGTLLMIETAAGLSRVRELATLGPSIRALLFGSADLRRSLGARPDAERRWEQHALSEILLAARVGGCAAIDAVTFKFRDDALLEREAGIARALGFDGKSCIHPCQVETIHRVFASTPDEIDWAERVLAAWQGQNGDEAGVIVLDGEMIEALHLDVAHRILDRRR